VLECLRKTKGRGSVGESGDECTEIIFPVFEHKHGEYLNCKAGATQGDSS